MSTQFGALKNQTFILETIAHQQVLKAKGKLISLNYGLYGKKKNPILQVASNVTSASSLRTDAANSGSSPKPPKRSASRPAPVVNRPQPQPKPKPVPNPPVCKPPRPPKQPPAPRPPVAPTPPPVPDQPSPRS
jgi:hypothetical protein